MSILNNLHFGVEVIQLKLEADDIFYLIQGLACAEMKRNLMFMSHALGEANFAVTKYLGIDIEFIIEGDCKLSIDQLRERLQNEHNTSDS